MSVVDTLIAPQRIQPFFRGDDSDAIGQMFGVARSTGDASGGIHVVGFALPQNNVYLIRHVTVTVITASDLMMDMSIGMGIITDGQTMSWRTIFRMLTDGTNTSATVEPQRLVIFPDADPAINTQISNIDGRIMDIRFQAVFWAKQAFIDMPSEKFSTFL